MDHAWARQPDVRGMRKAGRGRSVLHPRCDAEGTRAALAVAARRRGGPKPASRRPGERRDPYRVVLSIRQNWTTPSLTTTDGGYGSLLSQGRRRERFG